MITLPRMKILIALLICLHFSAVPTLVQAAGVDAESCATGYPHQAPPGTEAGDQCDPSNCCPCGVTLHSFLPLHLIDDGFVRHLPTALLCSPSLLAKGVFRPPRIA